MRKIIDGRTYNTATSKLIGEWSNGKLNNDFGYCSENLYVNTKGAYFISYEGGALSKYAIAVGSNNASGSQGITPMTLEESKKWAEEHLDAEDYEKSFEVPEEANSSDLTTRERVNLTLDSDIMTSLRKLSLDTGVPMARMVDKAIMAMYGDQFNK